MAHPKRKREVSHLVRRLDATPTVVWDKKNNVWDTGRRSLLAYAPDAAHHLVVQDDAVAPHHLVATCVSVIEHTPGDVPVSLYMGKARHRPHRFSMEPVVDSARQNGASFAVFPGPWWGVALIIPTAHIEALVAYGDKATHSNYDIRIAQFYKSKGIDCWYTMPSLVDHRQGPSLVGRRGSRRHAQWYADAPLKDLDWSGGHITPADMVFDGRFPVTP